MRQLFLYIILVFFSGHLSAQEAEDSLVPYGDPDEEAVVLTKKGGDGMDTFIVFSHNNQVDAELFLDAEKNSSIKIRNRSDRTVDVNIKDIGGCQGCVGFISPVSVGARQDRELKFSFRPDGDCEKETCSLLLSNYPKGSENGKGFPVRLKIHLPERSMNVRNKGERTPRPASAPPTDVEILNVEPTKKMTLMDYFIIAILVLSISAVAVISRLRQDFKLRLDALQNSQNELAAAVQAMKVPMPVNAAPVTVSTEEMERKLADLRDEVQRLSEENREVFRKLMERIGGA